MINTAASERYVSMLVFKLILVLKLARVWFMALCCNRTIERVMWARCIGGDREISKGKYEQ